MTDVVHQVMGQLRPTSTINLPCADSSGYHNRMMEKNHLISSRVTLHRDRTHLAENESHCEHNEAPGEQRQQQIYIQIGRVCHHHDVIECRHICHDRERALLEGGYSLCFDVVKTEK
ncbi:unnamed protein product [Pleuronectes platessa]|uniref:Uncharacterized protein n=1 Tax=Pleuronectes platessa TaxID=8262 RepID=A0A9N7U554_PLEPL|nr:unnamed protein product [Pleuronectes platessa]